MGACCGKHDDKAAAERAEWRMAARGKGKHAGAGGSAENRAACRMAARGKGKYS